MPVTTNAPLNLDRDPVDVAIGTRLRVNRTARRMSLETLGKALGLTYQQVQKYESGANRLSCSTLLRICAVLGCSTDDILHGHTPAGTDAGRSREDLSLMAKLAALPDGPARKLLVGAVHGMIDTVKRT